MQREGKAWARVDPVSQRVDDQWVVSERGELSGLPL